MMQNYIVVTVNGIPTAIPYNDGVHNLWVEKINSNPTHLEIRTDVGQHTIQSMLIEETPDEVARLMQLAKGQSLYYLSHIDIERINSEIDIETLNTTMMKLGFMSYSILYNSKRIELPKGTYLFDRTLPHNAHLNYTLDEVRTHIQDAITNQTGNLRYFANEFSERPLLTIAEARNVSWS